MDSIIEEGYLHFCYTCKISSTDDLETLRSLAIVRRALHGLWLDGYACQSIREFGQSIGVKDLRTANGILQRLVKEGWLKPRASQSGRTKGGRFAKQTPKYTVVRSTEIRDRLYREYFNPQRGLEKEYTNTDKSGRVSDGIKTAGFARAESDIVAQKPTASPLSLAMAAKQPGQSTASPGYAISDSVPISCTKEFRIQSSPQNNKRSRGQLECSMGSEASIIHESVSTCTDDTTDSGMDQDLSVPAKASNVVASRAQGIRLSPRATTQAKRLKVSIVKKPVISQAFDNMNE